eukprot:CAMPEP_0181102822 /NCGR_PEP_ID=MMETSP1071-20121207/14526_1 /TAXON_ID=35127 /ORGANISM="Thalassiosira sp., Strain NH16" /LENGTH=65 /DNA_ID=CAMNT_0023185833 /DNA_START=27 /DNA_END=220 /DNA_ORIENTATION=-
MPSGSTDTHTFDDAHASSSVLPSTTDIDLCLFDPPLTAADVKNASVAKGGGRSARIRSGPTDNSR